MGRFERPKRRDADHMTASLRNPIEQEFSMKTRKAIVIPIAMLIGAGGVGAAYAANLPAYNAGQYCPTARAGEIEVAGNCSRIICDLDVTDGRYHWRYLDYEESPEFAESLGITEGADSAPTPTTDSTIPTVSVNG